MKEQFATASRTIEAPAQIVYNIIADYHTGHPFILPKPYFLSLEVEAGGFGEGTIVRFLMRVFGQTQSFRARITEPEPGRVLQETDLETGTVTTFLVDSLQQENHTQVTITTALKNRGLVDGFLAKRMLQKIYFQELALLDETAKRLLSMEERQTLSNST